MFFKEKKQIEQKEEPKKEKNLYPVLHVVDSLKEYQKELTQKEVDSLQELSQVERSFETVMGEADSFLDKLSEFGEAFTNIDHVSGQFAEVKGEIHQSVTQAQAEVEELKNSSLQMNTYFDEIITTFESFQTSVAGPHSLFES